MEDKIIVYSTGCPMCKMLEKSLDRKGIKYEVVNDMNIMLEKGFKAAPVLEVSGEIFNAKEAIKWVAGK